MLTLLLERDPSPRLNPPLGRKDEKNFAFFDLASFLPSPSPVFVYLGIFCFCVGLEIFFLALALAGAFLFPLVFDPISTAHLTTATLPSFHDQSMTSSEFSPLSHPIPRWIRPQTGSQFSRKSRRSGNRHGKGASASASTAS